MTALTKLSVQLKFFLVLIVTFWLNQWFTGDGYRFYTLATFPGTFLHESAHWVFAAALEGHPSNFNLVPSGNTMGSINFHPNWYNAAAVGWAPLLLMPMTAFFAALTARMSLVWAPAWAYITACSWEASTPSPQDYSIALSVPTSWPLGAVILLIATWSVIRVARYMVFK